MEQRDRLGVMKEFKQGSFRYLCATDVAARGLDIEDLSLIHISEPTRLGMISYAVFCLKKKISFSFLTIRRPPRSTLSSSSAASDVYKRQAGVFQISLRDRCCGERAGYRGPVSYTHLRAHETRHDIVCRLLLEKKNIFFFFNDPATTEIYTILFVGSVRCV